MGGARANRNCVVFDDKETCSSAERKLTVLVVSYNTRELTLACLASVQAETRNLDYEVIVVDNASRDGTAEAVARDFPPVQLVCPEENRGFAKANNLAAGMATGEWLLLLNPDTVILDGAIDKALAFAAKQSGDVIVGGRTLFADGRLNPLSCHNRPTPWSVFCAAIGLARLFPGSVVFNAEALGSWKRDSVRQVDAISGCFLLIRRALWNRLGGFDESFFMYGEETDLCLRAEKLGARCLVCPEATLIHHGGASERVRADKMVKLLNAKVRLVHRHWARPWRPLAHPIVLLWPLTRAAAFWIARVARHSKSESLRPWLEVWRRRSEVIAS